MDGWENRVAGVWIDTVWPEGSGVTIACSFCPGCERVRQFYGLCGSRVRRNTHYQSEKWREGHSITKINRFLSLGSVNIRQKTTNWQRWKQDILFFICCILTLISLWDQNKMFVSKCSFKVIVSFLPDLTSGEWLIRRDSV